MRKHKMNHNKVLQKIDKNIIFKFLKFRALSKSSVKKVTKMAERKFRKSLKAKKTTKEAEFDLNT